MATPDPMSTHTRRVLVGIPTYRRTRMLDHCLASLAAQQPCPGWSGSVLVVDNDGDAGAGGVVQSWQARFALPLRYEIEPERGNSQTRNRVIAHALAIGADYIVFIDDDETAEVDWLRQLTGIIDASGAHAIHGPVHPHLADCPGSWWQHKPPPLREELAELPVVFTNNVIFSTVLTRDWGLRFDTRFALTGGGDHEFFLRARRRGAVYRWTNRAAVHETIPCDRQSLGWQLRRIFRIASGEVAIRRKHHGFRGTLRYLWKAPLRILGGLLRLPFTPLARLGGTQPWRRALFKSLSAIASGLGMLAGLVNYNIKMYR